MFVFHVICNQGKTLCSPCTLIYDDEEHKSLLAVIHRQHLLIDKFCFLNIAKRIKPNFVLLIELICKKKVFFCIFSQT
jgi:hypothetical protein